MTSKPLPVDLSGSVPVMCVLERHCSVKLKAFSLLLCYIAFAHTAIVYILYYISRVQL